MKTKLFLIALLVMSIVTIGIAGILNLNSKNEGLITKSIQKRKPESEAVTFLRKIAVRYRSTKQFYSNIEYEIFDEKNPGKVVESFKGICAYDIQNCYIKSISSEEIINNEFSIIVSDDEKVIFIKKRDTLDDGKFHTFNPRILDSIQLLAINDIQMDKSNPELFIITYIPRFESWKKVQLLFNPITLDVAEMKMWVGDSYTDTDFGLISNPVIRCKYVNQRFYVQGETDIFRTEKYLTFIKGKLSGVGRLASYEIELLN